MEPVEVGLNSAHKITADAPPVEAYSGVGTRASPDARAVLAIAGAVVLANILYVSGVFDPNPLGPRVALGW